MFDELGRLTQSQQIRDGQTYTSSYEYNLSGALVKQTYPNGRVVENQFEADGNLSRIYGKANSNAAERTYANSFSYTPDGRIEKLRLGNHRWEWAKFNERLQVTELNWGSGVQDASPWKLKYLFKTKIISNMSRFYFPDFLSSSIDSIQSLSVKSSRSGLPR